MQTKHAICRSLPDSFHRAIAQNRPASPINVQIARQQHEAYVHALQSLGVQVTVLQADSALPDCCFVEDCAVCADGTALITRLGADSRRGEEQAVAQALKPHAHLEWMAAPATLDGGDCLRLGSQLFVGRSQRTNAADIDSVRGVFVPLGFEVIDIPLGPVLHLKCVCSRLDDDTLLLADGAVSPEFFAGKRVVRIPAAEPHAANCVCVNGTALLAAGCPDSRRLIRAEGFEVIELDMSEIRKADGSMTCLSILL
jgi:dimethylargininase